MAAEAKAKKRGGIPSWLRSAREVYRYVARTYPAGADLEPLGRADRAVLEAEERGDWPTYEQALRGLCRIARRAAIEALRARGAA